MKTKVKNNKGGALLCAFGFHRWTKWQLYDHLYHPRKGLFGEVDTSVTGKDTVQIRRCKVCGKTQEERV